MCGIAGIVGEESSLKSKCKKMLDMIQHRGPDDLKIINNKSFAGGTARLSIEALSNGLQPIEDNNYIIGFNGEIFNYKKIICKFNLNKKICNSEISVLLELFKIKKEKFVNYLNGQFAIFIFDKKKKKLFLFRDPYGIRPLYYHKNKKNFYFSSEMKSIVKVSNYNFSVDIKSITQTAFFWTNIGNQTSIKNIEQVEPGHFAIYKDKKIYHKKYFIDPLIKNKNNKKNEVDPKDVFNNLSKSVKNQLQSEVGYACAISGGIDSAAIAYILSKNSKKKIDTFSISFKDKSYDESIFQKKVSNFLKTKHHTIKINKEDIANNFEKVINHTESILFRTAPVPMFLLNKKVSKQKHKVFFTGEGADEMTLGYDIFFENRIRKYWSKEPNSKNIPNLFSKLYKYLPQFQNKRYLNLTLDFYKKFINFKNNDHIFSHRVRWSQFSQVSAYFNIKSSKIKKQLIKDVNTILKKNNIFSLNSDEKCQILEFNTLLSNYLLSSQGDRVSMANSVEGRYPYLDNNFTEFYSKINSNLKAPEMESKKLLREAFRNKLPKEIINRPKIAYQAPEAKAFLDHNYISKCAKEFLNNYNKIDYFNKKNVKSLIEKIKSPHSSQRLGFRENMGFIMCLSVYYLDKQIKKWEK
jgi:asparagine synthase (glutamine-hydrolysing)